MKWLEHLKTINAHRREVRKNCFAIGLYWQGLTHDLSKYSWTEFSMGAKYYQGNRSPNDAEREDKGYTSAWLHHKGRNKHHLEYWIDYSVDKTKGLVGCRMPERYVLEMFCDRIAACKIYNGDSYHQGQPLEYYNKGRAGKLLHEESKAMLVSLLTMLAEKGESYTFRYVKENYVLPIRRNMVKKICPPVYFIVKLIAKFTGKVF